MSTVLLLIPLLFGAAYGLLILVYLAGWLLQKKTVVAPGFEPTTSISIIIPARNEAANIGNCIRSILAQQYPHQLFELIVVDDFSDDDTALIVQSFNLANVRLIQLKDIIADRSAITAFKKLALQSGIGVGQGALIVTTDADCTFKCDWLLTMAYAYETTQAKMIVAPVDFTSNGSLVEIFQSLDFRTMQGITAAAHQFKLGHMANGANLAFSKAAYESIHGYEGTTHIASGDDYLLLVKMARRFPRGIHYLKNTEAIVSTAPQPTWMALLNQRIRWASKSGKYKDHRLSAILALVYFFNVSLLMLSGFAFFNTDCLHLLACLLTGKVLLEIIFLLPVSNFFGRQKSLIIFPFLQPLHILYIGLAGFLGLMGNYEWKGRQLK